MQIVISIEDEFYDYIKEQVKDGITNPLKVAIVNGKILPKGHGDLIDKGKFKKWIETQDGDKLMTEYYLDALEMQEAIVRGSYDGDID